MYPGVCVLVAPVILLSASSAFKNIDRRKMAFFSLKLSVKQISYLWVKNILPPLVSFSMTGGIPKNPSNPMTVYLSHNRT